MGVTRYREQTIHNTDCNKINCPVSKQPVYDSCQGSLTWVPPPWLGTAESPESRLECVYVFSGRKRCSFQILGRIPYLKRDKPRARRGRKWSSSTAAAGTQRPRLRNQVLGCSRRWWGCETCWGPTGMRSLLPSGCRLPEESDKQEKEATASQGWPRPLLSHLLIYTGTSDPINTSWTFWGQSWNPREVFSWFLSGEGHWFLKIKAHWDYSNIHDDGKQDLYLLLFF